MQCTLKPLVLLLMAREAPGSPAASSSPGWHTLKGPRPVTDAQPQLSS